MAGRTRLRYQAHLSSPCMLALQNTLAFLLPQPRKRLIIPFPPLYARNFQRSLTPIANRLCMIGREPSALWSDLHFPLGAPLWLPARFDFACLIFALRGEKDDLERVDFFRWVAARGFLWLILKKNLCLTISSSAPKILAEHRIWSTHRLKYRFYRSINDLLYYERPVAGNFAPLAKRVRWNMPFIGRQCGCTLRCSCKSRWLLCCHCIDTMVLLRCRIHVLHRRHELQSVDKRLPRATRGLDAKRRDQEDIPRPARPASVPFSCIPPVLACPSSSG